MRITGLPGLDPTMHPSPTAYAVGYHLSPCGLAMVNEPDEFGLPHPGKY